MAIGLQDTTIAPGGPRVAAIAITALGVAVEVGLVAWGHVDVLLRATPGVALGVALAVTMLWLPRLRVRRDDVEVRNPFRTHRVGWGAVDGIGTRWTLSLVTSGTRIPVWVAPTAESHVATDSIGQRSPIAPETVVLRASASAAAIDTHVDLTRRGGASGVVARQWLARRDEAGAADPLSSSWNLGTIAVLGVLIALTAAGIAWP